MARETIVDISNSPELLALAEEVLKTRRPRVLTRGGDRLAVVRPAGKRRASTTVSQADYEAFLSSFGGWQGIVDVDRFLKDNEESRRLSIRPPVEL